MRRHILTTAVRLLALIGGSAEAATAATAATVPPPSANHTGADVTPEGMAAPMTQQAKDKVAATLAWAKAAQAGDLIGAARAEAAYEAKHGGPGAVSSRLDARTGVTGVQAAVTAVPTSRRLGVVQVGQLASYYCGPASGYEIIRYLNGAGSTSRYDRSALSQRALANLNHMATDANRVTDWNSGRWALGVNRWRGVNWYVQVHAPSATLLKSVALQSIGGNGMPFAGDTVEFERGAHYNNHPNRTIGHWIAAYAYSSSGASVSWADSSTTIFHDAAPYFTYSSVGFAGFLLSNGIAY